MVFITSEVEQFDPDHFLNRELSWLEFNRRVLSLSQRPDFPLLERAKFLAIWASNLDEFFQVRVAGLKEQVSHGVGATPPDGMTPSQQLAAIRNVVDLQYEADLQGSSSPSWPRLSVPKASSSATTRPSTMRTGRFSMASFGSWCSRW